MTDAPARIWAYTGDGMGNRMTDHGTWDTGLEGQPDCHPEWPHEAYVRADLADARLERSVRATLEAAADCCIPHCDDDSLDRQAKLECALTIRAIDPAQIVKEMNDD